MTSFPTLRNNVATTLRTAHVPGDGLLRVAAGAGASFGAVFPLRVTCQRATDGVVVIFPVTARTGDDLTVSGAVEGTADIDLPAGTACEVRVTAAAFTDLHAAVNALEGAGGGSPGGADTQVQFNDGGVFGGSAGILYHKDWKGLGVGSGQALGLQSAAFGYSCVAACDWSIAEGNSTRAGVPPHPCVIAGTTVTFPGVDVSGDFWEEDGQLVLSGLSGGVGPVAVRGSVTAAGASFAGGNTTLTLKAAVTPHTAGFAHMANYTSACHAEGQSSIAEGYASHAECYNTTSSGLGSHAEGAGVIASATGAHAEGVASRASLTGQHAFASGMFAVPGDGQGSRVVLMGVTDGATPVTLLVGTTSYLGSAGQRLAVRSGFAYNFYVRVTARKTDGTKHAKFCREGLIHNEAGTTSLEGAVQTVGTDTNTPGWSVAITADDATDSLQIQVTGEATVRWQATVWLGEVGS